MTDFIHAAADALLLYKVKEITPRARELAVIVVKAAEQLEKAMANLRSRSQMKAVLDYCIELNRLENEADVVYRAALAELFDDAKDVRDVIKWREIYEHMESATDRCEDVANVLEGIVLKHG